MYICMCVCVKDALNHQPSIGHQRRCIHCHKRFCSRFLVHTAMACRGIDGANKDLIPDSIFPRINLPVLSKKQEGFKDRRGIWTPGAPGVHVGVSDGVSSVSGHSTSALAVITL